jgi:hypothetical protein
MGLGDIFGKEIKGARQLREYYRGLADKYDLDYIPGADHFLVLANKRLSEDADPRKWDTPPWSGIKTHSPLSVEMYNVLRSNDFIQMLKNGEIDGFKVYLYEDDSTRHKEVTIYISPYSMPNLRKLLNILEKNGISIQPVLTSYYDGVLLNRMYIAPNEEIFVRFSTDFTGKMNVNQDYIIDKYMGKIDDQTWRDAADILRPYIVAVSRSWLLYNQHNLDGILRNSSSIYTFITLKEISRGSGRTIVPNPHIIIRYEGSNNQLIAYDVLGARIVRFDLSNEEDRERISDHPKERVGRFLKYGTAYP